MIQTMIGVLANALAILLGGFIGSRLKSGIPEKFKVTINHGLALCVLVIGIAGAVKTQNMMLMIVSIVLGGAAGEALRIEDHLSRLGDWAQSHLAKDDDGFSRGFITATLLFCVGAMAVVGSIEAGMLNKPDTLLAKSLLDGVASLIYASTLGAGVMLSALPILVYQGGIAVLAALLGNFLPEEAVLEVAAVGSVLIIGLGLNMLESFRERIRVGNLLPAVLIPALYITLRALFGV